jgi:hypothetical protein
MATIDKDPLLTENSNDGIYQLQSDSPACKKFPGTPFEKLTRVDIYGVTRGENTDAGCHQYSTVTPKPMKVITKDYVGPKAALIQGGSPPAWLPHPEKN